MMISCLYVSAKRIQQNMSKYFWKLFTGWTQIGSFGCLGATLESRCQQNAKLSPNLVPQGRPKWPNASQRDPFGGLGLPKVIPKWAENDTRRHFGNWWRLHWVNLIIYYAFGGSLAEKHIIYYVLTCSKQLLFTKLYENLIIYYVLKPPEKSASLRPSTTWHTPSLRPPPL